MPAVVNLPTTVDRFGADVADVAAPLPELRSDLRPLLQRIVSLERQNIELETLARNLEQNIQELSALVFVDALTV
jgi:hypothetical protein